MPPMMGVYSGQPPFMLRPKASQIDYIWGLDLGKEMDYSGLVLLERSRVQDLARPESRPFHLYSIRYIYRWLLNTTYDVIIPKVCEFMERPEMKFPTLVVDYTGPGSGVVDFLRAAKPKARIIPVQFTAGSAVTQQADGHWHVAKPVLISVMQVLIQSERMKCASDLEKLGDLLIKELHNFKRKITAAANETFEAWRERDHDDLVLATAIAAWWGEQGGHDYFPSKQPTPNRPRTPMDMNRARGANWRRKGMFGSR